MAKSDKTYYDILGLSPIATNAEIKRAYRTLVKTRHPDPGNTNKTDDERTALTEQTLLLNLAYETLKDKKRRGEYDVIAGIAGRPLPQFKFEKDNEDEQRAKFLSQVFHPTRTSIYGLINRYKKEIQDLAQDPYDDELVESFAHYLDDLEAVLRKGSDGLTRNPAPKTLEAAALMMRYCISQAADALDELRLYCLNYNYQHLTMAETLFKIAIERAKEALALTRH